MKKLFGLFICFFVAVSVLADDDVMITRDGTMTEVKVEKMSTSQVSYIDLKNKKRGSQTVSTQFVYMIMREKGKNIFFDEEGNQMTAPVVKFDKKDDVMFLNKGEMFVVYNLSVSKDDVSYQLQDKKKAPVIKTPKSEVFMVRNSDGTTTLFNDSFQEKQRARRQAAASPDTTTGKKGSKSSLASAPPVSSKIYKVGDIYNENGLKGIVVDVDELGDHGLIMSLETCGKKWSAGGDLKTETECFDQEDGQKNFDAIVAYVKETGSSWDALPLFKWAKDLGEGWYIPANRELELIAKAISGGTMNYDEKTVDNFSKLIKDAGGDPIINKGFGHDNFFKTMFSSTEIEGGSVYRLELAETKGSAIGSALLGKMAKKKGELRLTPTVKNLGNIGVKMIGSRAVHKF